MKCPDYSRDAQLIWRLIFCLVKTNSMPYPLVLKGEIQNDRRRKAERRFIDLNTDLWSFAIGCLVPSVMGPCAWWN